MNGHFIWPPAKVCFTSLALKLFQLQTHTHIYISIRCWSIQQLLLRDRVRSFLSVCLSASETCYHSHGSTFALILFHSAQSIFASVRACFIISFLWLLRFNALWLCVHGKIQSKAKTKKKTKRFSYYFCFNFIFLLSLFQFPLKRQQQLQWQ